MTLDFTYWKRAVLDHEASWTAKGDQYEVRCAGWAKWLDNQLMAISRPPVVRNVGLESLKYHLVDEGKSPYFSKMANLYGLLDHIRCDARGALMKGDVHESYRYDDHIQPVTADEVGAYVAEIERAIALIAAGPASRDRDIGESSVVGAHCADDNCEPLAGVSAEYPPSE